MKNINRLLTLILFLGLALTGCETELDDPTGARDLIGATPVIENLNPSIFLAADKENTYVAFDVTAGESDETMEAIIEVSYDGGQERVQLSEFTIPATGVEVSLSDVATALGISTDAMEGGKYVNIEVLTKAGDKYYRSSAAVNPLIACDYIAADYVGTANAESSDWAVNGPVEITLDPSDPTGYTLLVSGLAELDGLTEDGGPLPLVINPANYEITVPATILASSAWGYSDFFYEGSGSLNTCSQDIYLNVYIGVSIGGWGYNEFYITY